MTTLLGLRTVKYTAPDLTKAKGWWKEIFGITPYFDEPFYVGYNVGGFELGLDPNAAMTGDGGTLAYWGVADLESELRRVAGLGVRVVESLQEVGEGIKVAAIEDPFGNRIGLIENPHFGG